MANNLGVKGLGCKKSNPKPDATNYKQEAHDESAPSSTTREGEVDELASMVGDIKTECLEDWDREKPNLISQLMIVNKNLEEQITTLRLRLEFDCKHNEAARFAAEQQFDIQVKSKEHEINKLRSSVDSKDDKIKSLLSENKQKSREINNLEAKISDMKKDLNSTRKFASELQQEMHKLHTANKRLEKGVTSTDKDKEIKSLLAELEELKMNANTLDIELDKAKEIISKQGGKIRLLENDKINMQVRLKEELSKLTLSMRFEIEKMRDVMKQQWDEMKVVRTQNENLQGDLSEIKELLMSAQFQTHRGQETTRSNAHGRLLKPSFPPLTKDKQNLLLTRKK